jgi:RNA-directed DNA polymerase
MPEIKSNFNLEKIFGKDPETILETIQNKEKFIYSFDVPKKDGSARHIVASRGELKWLQNGALFNVLSIYSPSAMSHGFVKGRSTRSNAEPHVAPMSMGHIDIKNFFDTINTNHIKVGLCGNRNVCRLCKNFAKMQAGKCSPSMYENRNTKFSHRCEEIKALYIADYFEKTGYLGLLKTVMDLSTRDGHTVQGFPTSPYLANIVLKPFDKKMIKVAKENSCSYTRYADDLAFTSHDKSSDDLKRVFGKTAWGTLKAIGFEVNEKKTWWKESGRMKICGIVVNEKLNPVRWQFHNFRAMVHQVTHTPTMNKKRLRRAMGLASYYHSINSEKTQPYIDKLNAYITANKEE